jgi:hypothetical protein
MTALSPTFVTFCCPRIGLLEQDLDLDVAAPRLVDGVGRPFVSLNHGAQR